MAPIAVESACDDNRLSYTNNVFIVRCEKKKKQTTEIVTKDIQVS